MCEAWDERNVDCDLGSAMLQLVSFLWFLCFLAVHWHSKTDWYVFAKRSQLSVRKLRF